LEIVDGAAMYLDDFEAQFFHGLPQEAFMRTIAITFAALFLSTIGALPTSLENIREYPTRMLHIPVKGDLYLTRLASCNV
jgi:ABC-type phosphate/phosphonate transport system permease subunit